MTDLIAPHGGLTEPVCCTVGEKDRDAFLAEAKTLTQVPVSSADLSTVYRFGDGTLSPLTGPMDSAVYNQVLDECFVISNGKKYAWTIPLDARHQRCLCLAETEVSAIRVHDRSH